jgi:hypothetical protein
MQNLNAMQRRVIAAIYRNSKQAKHIKQETVEAHGVAWFTRKMQRNGDTYKFTFVVVRYENWHNTVEIGLRGITLNGEEVSLRNWKGKSDFYVEHNATDTALDTLLTEFMDWGVFVAYRAIKHEQQRATARAAAQRRKEAKEVA